MCVVPITFVSQSLVVTKNPPPPDPPRSDTSKPTRTVPKARQADFTKLIHRLDEDVQKLARGLTNSDDAIRAWHDDMLSLIRTGHLDSYSLGVLRSAGVHVDPARAAEIADQARDLESYYLLRFRNAILDGDPRYIDEDGLIRSKPIAQRSRLYLGSMRGTAGTGWVDGTSDTDQFDWRLGGTEEHCEDCPFISDGSPYDKLTLFTTPGAGRTPCLGNCLCHLVRVSDGQASFKPVSLDPLDDL